MAQLFRGLNEHQVSDPWSQTRSVFSHLGTWVLARKEFRTRTQTVREHVEAVIPRRNGLRRHVMEVKEGPGAWE